MKKLLNDIKQLLHEYFSFVHGDCDPAVCRTAAQDQERREYMWAQVRRVHQRGPCVQYNGKHVCRRCDAYETATAILNKELPIEAWEP